MRNRRRAVAIAAVFLVAAATAHVMQRGDTMSARLRGAITETRPGGTAVVGVTELASASSAIDVSAASVSAGISATPLASAPAASPAPAPIVATTPAVEPVIPVSIASAGLGFPLAPLPPVHAERSGRTVLGIACGPATLSLGTTSGALLRVTLDAPCHPKERVTIRHAGLTFADTTDLAGHLEVTVPAFATPASVVVGFDNGDRLSEMRQVPDLHAVTRTAVAWSGVEGFGLAAIAAMPAAGLSGETRAVSAVAKTPQSDVNLIRLGDPGAEDPKLALVSTAPADLPPAEIEISAEITAATCGKELSGQILRLAPGGARSYDQIGIAMAGCDTIGGAALLRLVPVAEDDVKLALLGG